MKTKNNKKALIFSAHPDDHLCCAGTLMYLRDLGFSLTEAVFTGGEKSIWIGKDEKNKALNSVSLVSKRAKELSEASKLIGIEKSISLGLPDSNVQRSLDLLDRIIEIVRAEKPTIIFTQSPTDYHHDHRVIGDVSTEAVDRAAWGISRALGEPHRTPVLLYFEGCYFNRSDLLIDVSKYEKRKEKLFDIYKSQMSERSKRMLLAMNTYRGYFNRSTNAESFEVAKNYPIYFNKFIELITK